MVFLHGTFCFVEHFGSRCIVPTTTHLSSILANMFHLIHLAMYPHFFGDFVMLFPFIRFAASLVSRLDILLVFGVVVVWNGAVTTAYAMWAQTRGQAVVAPSEVRLRHACEMYKTRVISYGGKARDQKMDGSRRD